MSSTFPRSFSAALSRSFPVLCVGVAIALPAGPARAGTVYVNVAQPTGANNGSSWADAYQGVGGLQTALGAAAAGDQIWVAKGTYKPAQVGFAGISFGLRDGVSLYGGFVGGETSLAERDVASNETILSGDLNGDGQISGNSSHVVRADAVGPTAVLDGFTVRDGYAAGSEMYGGGILCHGSPTIRNCVLRANRAWQGGGAYAEGGPSFLDVRFEWNLATGGVTPAGNVIPGAGGGCCLFTSSYSPSFSRCSFLHNTAFGDTSFGGGGGGLSFLGFQPLSHVDVTNCLFFDNETPGGQGGGALLLYGPSDVRNCTVVGNKSTAQETAGVLGNGQTTVANTILFFNQGPGGATGSANQVSGAAVSYCCVQGGASGTGNLSGDPQFVDSGAGDFTLSPSSPCADSGNNGEAAGSLVDLAGNPRFADDPQVPDSGVGDAPIVDIGAYEVQNTLYADFCAGDGTLATACPCANPGATGHGCANSDSFGLGARLAVSGTANPDTVVLTSSGMLPSVSCVFLQGDALVPGGVVYGDGVRCVGGHLVRLGLKTASSGTASYPQAGDPSITARSAALGDPIAPGSTRAYQTYYRDPDPSYCPAPQGATWNVSSGVVVSW